METVKVEFDTYTFEELDPKVQEKVIEEFKTSKSQWDSDFIFECVLEEWKEKLDGMGFYDPKIYFSGFSYQGDGACFEAECYLPDIIKHLDTHKYRHLLPFIDETSISCTIEKNSYGWHYSHERTRYIDLDFPFWDERCPRAAALCQSLKEDLEELRYDLAHELYKALENEYWYALSDEVIKEDILCNDYVFLEDGELADRYLVKGRQEV